MFWKLGDICDISCLQDLYVAKEIGQIIQLCYRLILLQEAYQPHAT